MNLPRVQNAIKRLATPAVQQVNVNPTQLRRSLWVVYPCSLSEQQAILEILSTHDERIRAEEAYRDKLKLQKQGLMHDLLTGRVRV
jgi:type I restriction enzyme S subunit